MSLLDWSNAVNPERIRITFENRNKEYGAFVLRTKYQKRVVTALLVSIAGLTLAVVTPMAISYLSKKMEENKAKVTEAITLAEPPPIDKTTPPPPPVIPPPPVQQTIKFTPPKVVKDEEAQEPPPTQEETTDVAVSTVTQEGEKNLPELPPDPVVADPDEGKVFTVVEEMPVFPGGDDKLLQYISSNIKYPQMAKENGITGRVFVQFVVGKDGKVHDAKIVRGIGGGCDEEALRVVRSLPDWKPGRQNGREVQVQFTLPVSFVLKN